MYQLFSPLLITTYIASRICLPAKRQDFRIFFCANNSSNNFYLKTCSIAVWNATEPTMMVTSLEENANETKNTNKDQIIEEFHDAATVHTGEKPTLTGAEWKEFNLLLEITYKDRTKECTSPQKHMMMLKVLGNAFDNT
jgi:hypothetical protein